MSTPCDHLDALLYAAGLALDEEDLDAATPLLAYAGDWLPGALDEDPDRGAELQLLLRETRYRYECARQDEMYGAPARIVYLEQVAA